MTPEEEQQIEDEIRLLIDDFQKWSEDVVEKPHDMFGGLPACPFAGHAWSSGIVNLHITPDLENVAGIKAVMDQDEPTVNVILWTGSEDMTPDEFNNWVDAQNEQHFGVWIMGFHPDAEVNGSLPPFEGLIEDDYGVVLVQSLGRLVRASDRLRRAGYYRNFSQDDMKYINRRREVFNAWHEEVAKKMFPAQENGQIN